MNPVTRSGPRIRMGRGCGWPARLAAPALAASPPASAATGTIDSGDTAWLLMASAMVLLMTVGLALFYGGLVRRKNILSVLMQCFTCMALLTVLWVAVGYSLAFGPSYHGWIGAPGEHAFLRDIGLEPLAGGTIPHLLFVVFQGMFAIITPALILGGFAERLRFGPFCLFIALWLVAVYCPLAHWTWGGGLFAGGEGGSWLMQPGQHALDFAGGTVVHINAGLAALAAAIVLGPRQGYPEKTSPPHNLPIAVLGGGLLWFGWFGFNAGSQLAADAIAANAFIVTQVATAMAALSWAVIDWLREGKPTTLGLVTGAVAGLVAITPACGYVDVMGALAVGLGAGIVAYISVAVVKPAWGYDDALDVFGVHGVAGVWGALATGLWAAEAIGGTPGLFEGNADQLWVQLKAVVLTVLWSFAISLALWKLIDAMVGLRASPHAERVGLDLTEHAEAGYTLLE